ncbi:MAG: adenylyltransferase/cytidyltransferase family protein, partial [Candidatus Pacebacteria bacterium]|nr:adenylyltransferase/cytidyltransferase family protein [Candidatus Paceibacterota bacterium]
IMEIKNKIITDYEKLAELIKAQQILGNNVVCTIGSWDMLHIGHLRYLNTAKQQGDILVVGVDSDRAIKIYKKNSLRPVIPEEERMEMLSYQSFVDYVTIIDDVDEKGDWEMNILRKVNPDIFVAIEESYPKEQREKIEKLCGEMKLLERQAENTSTSDIIEKTFKKRLEHILSNIKL